MNLENYDETNPYNSSHRYHPNRAWWDTFAKGGKLVTLVFYGDVFLAEVRNSQQAMNLIRHLREEEKNYENSR